MKKKTYNILFVLEAGDLLFYGASNQPAIQEENEETVLQRDAEKRRVELEPDTSETEILGNKLSEPENTKSESEETGEAENKLSEKDAAEIEKYYGTYRVIQYLPLGESNDRIFSNVRQQGIIGKIYGEYQVKEFLPTKCFPSYYFERSKFPMLPQEEADMMIGKTIVISEETFVTYDNYREPTSEAANRTEDGFWLDKIKMENSQDRSQSGNMPDLSGWIGRYAFSEEGTDYRSTKLVPSESNGDGGFYVYIDLEVYDTLEVKRNMRLKS